MSKPRRRAPLMMALEPRLMFDGAIAATAHALANDHHDHALAAGVGEHQFSSPAATGPAVIFVDSRVADADSLLKGVAAGTEIVHLQANKDGLQQISSYLAKHHEVGSVDIIAHGSDAQLQLGATDLNSSNIQSFAGELTAIGANLRSGADILVYACNTAADSRGVGFVDDLARNTGHVVAASSNLTGAGGDWKLEIATGTVTAAPVLSAASEAHYAYALSSLTAATDAQLQNAIATADADLTGNDTITLTSNITFASAADTLAIVHPGTGTLTINGGGYTIDADYLSRVLTVTSGRVVLENVTITHGIVAGVGGANLLAGGSALGAGITNAGILTLSNVNVTDNYATGGGGGGGGAVQTLAPNVSASGGGGGSGVSSVGGAAGGAGISGTTIVPGGAASGATGGSGGAVPHGGAGIGGSATGGGAGGAGTTSVSGAYASGASGATATAGGFTVGGGGGGSGRAGTGGNGGAAAGGIYNSGKLYVVGTSTITGNAAAGGGGGGGGGALNSGGNGGQGVGGIMNSALGTVNLTSSAFASMTGNSGVSGAIGAVVGGGSNTLVTQPTAYNNINTSGFINTSYSPAAVTSITRTGTTNPNNGSTEQFTVVFSQAVTGLNTLDFVLTNTGTAGGLITGISGSGTTYTVTVSAVFGDGTMRLDLLSNPVLLVDANGNPVLAGYSSGQTYTLDHTAPYATAVNLVGPSTNNASSEQFTIDFSENVTGVNNTANFTLVDTGSVQGTIQSVTGSGSVYTVTVNNVSGNGTMQLDLNVANTGIVDLVGNSIAGGFITGPVYTLQHTAPSVTSITTVGSSANNASSEQYTVNFSEPVLDVNALDFSLTDTGSASGVISSVTGSGSTYTVTVSPALGTGTMRLDVNSNAPIVDAAGNLLSGGYTSGQVYTLDHTAPFATAINTVGSSPNNASSEQFNVVFSENVTGVAASDFTLLNTGTVQGSIGSVSGSGNSYIVTVNGVSGNGTMQLDLNVAGTGITDTVGNPIVGGFLTGQIYTLQHTAPTVTSIVPVQSSPSSALSDQFTVTFSEAVTGVALTDFHLTDTGTATGLITGVTGSGSTYTVTVGSALGDGTMRLDLNSGLTGIVDAAGNSITSGYSSGTPLTVDHTPPYATAINTVGASPNNASSEQFTVQFSENVIGVVASDFTLADTGTVSGSIASVSGSGSTYTVTVNNVSGNGTMQLDLNALNTGITDIAGNAIVGGFLTGQIYTLQHTGPSVSSIVPVGNNPSNALVDQYTVTFSEAVTGVNITDFHLTDTGTASGVITAVTGSGSTYTVTVGSVLGDGTMRLDLNSALTGIVDAAGNSITGGYSSGTPLTVDHTPPYATGINTVTNGPNNSSSEQFTVQFSEAVTGVVAGDFSLLDTGSASGTIASVSGSGSVYTVTVNNVTGDGTMQLNLNASNTGITDLAGNAIVGGYFTGQVYDLQHTPPSVTSVVAVGNNPSNALSDQFTVTFSENVTGVNLNDFHLTDTGTASGLITSVTGSGSTYTVTVSPVLGDGTMRLDVNSGATGITDAAGNAFTAGYSSGTVLTVDHTAPFATAINTVGPSPNSASSEQFTVQFSENVTGVVASDFTLVDTGTVSGTIGTVTGSGSAYTVTVNNVNGNGTMQLDLNSLNTGITDTAGNPLVVGFATGQIYTLQHTAPVVTSIVPVTSSPNNAPSDQFTVTFSENVVGVDVTDFHLTDTGTAGGVISAVSGSGSTYTVTVAPALGDGTMRLDLNSTGTGIVDYAGNSINGGYSSGGVITVEHTAPVVSSINTVGANPNNASSEQFQVNFSENVTGVDISDFTLVNTGTVNGTIAAVSGTGSTYTVTVNNVNGNGTMQLDLNALGTGITDAAGNALVGGFAAGEFYTLQHTAPVVTSITAVGASPNNALSEQYTVTFSENVVGVDALDFHLTDTGTAAGAISAVTGSGSVYTVTVAPVAGDGTMRLDLNSSGTGIVDYSGNAINGGFSSGSVITVEHTPPTATSIVLLSPNPTSSSSDQFQVTFSENVTGVATGAFSLVDTGTVGGTVSAVTGSGNTYTVTVGNVVGTGTLELALNAANTGITDAAGNGLLGGALSSPYTVTAGPGVLSITPVGPSPNNATTEMFTVDFNTPVTGVVAGDFSLTDTGTASGTIGTVTGAGSIYTVTVTNAAGDGTMRLDLNAAATGIQDLSGTAVSGGFTGGTTVTLQHTAPTVVSIVPVSVTTDGSTESFTVNFSENVIGVNAADFSLSNTGTATGTITTVTGSGSTYTVNVAGVTGDGTSRLDLKANSPITDLAGNFIVGGYTAGGTVDVDHTPPTVSSITRVGANPNNANSDQYTVTFSEAVTGVDASDFALTNSGSVAGTVTGVTGSGSTYTVTVSNVTGDGSMRLDLNASGTGITDIAGNPISGGYTGGQTYTIEHTPPSVTSIALAGGSPNNAGSDQYTVTFSESVTGVDAADFALTTSGSVAGTVATVSGSGSTYTVTVNNVTGDGTMRLDLNASGTGIADAAGNAVSGGYTAGASYTIEHTPPSVASIGLVGPATNNASSDQYTVTFSENVTGVGVGDFVLTNSGNVAGSITGVSGSGSTYTVTVGNVTGDGSMRLDLSASGTGIVDAAGNGISGGYTGGPSYTIEHTPPSVTSISLAGSNPNDAGTEQFTVNFSENVTGVTTGDFALTNTGNVLGTITSIAGSGSTYTVTVNNVSGSGTMRLDVNASGTGIVDAAGNAISGGYSAGASYTIGNAGPVVDSITTVGASPNNANSDQFTVTFSENVSGVDASDFSLTATGSAAGSIAAVAGSGSTYTVTVNNVTGDGTLRLDLNASGTGITDAAGNVISGGYTAGASYTIEHTPPSVTSIGLVGQSPNNSTSEQYTVTFSENVSGVDVGDFALTTTGSAAGTISAVTGSGNTYTVTVANVSGNGTMRLDLNASGTGIMDAAGNAISGGYTAGASYTLQHTAPSVTSINTVGATTNNANSDQFTVTFSESVTGVDAGDFALTTSGNVSGSITSVTGSGSSYVVTVGNVAGDGTMRLDLNASGTGITDAAGNRVSGGFTGGASYTIEHTPPSVTSIALADPNPSFAPTDQYTVTFSENVTGVDVSDFVLTTTGNVSGTIASVTGSGTTYTVTVTSVGGIGTMRLDLNASGTGITDAAGNNISGGYTAGASYVVGQTAPVVTSIALVGPAINNAGTDQYTVTFSENVTGVDAGDFSLTNSGSVLGTVTSVSGSGSVYTVTVANVTGDGSMRLDLNSSATNIQNALTQPIAAGYTSGPSYTIEHTPPSVTSIALVGASINNAGAEQFTVMFSESVSGVDAGDFTLNNGGNVTGSISSVSGSGNTYVVTANDVTGDGTMRLDLNASGTGIVDAAGNAIGGGYTAGPSYTIEHTPPSVTSITLVGGTPNNAGSEQFTVTFSENVTGVDSGDFVLTTTGSAAGTISAVVGSGSTYVVTASNVTGDGTMRLDLADSGTGITDAAGNAIGGGYATGPAYTLEHTAPIVTSIALVGASPNDANSDQYTVTFSESVTGVDVSDFALATTGNASGSIGSVTGSGTTYTVVVNGVTGDGTMRLDVNNSGTGISDAAGNALVSGYQAGPAYTIEHTAPIVTAITAAGPIANNATSEIYTVNFSESVSGVDVSDFILTTSGNVGGTIASIAGSGSTYTVTVNNVTGDGTLRLDLNPTGTGIADAAGNPLNGGFNTGDVYTIEHSAPVVSSIDTVGANPNNSGSEQFTVTFSQNVSGVGTGDFTLTTTGGVAGTIASVSGSGDTYTVTVSGVTGDGTLRLDLDPSGTGITDAAGNAIAGGFTGGQVYTLQHTAPTVTSIATTGNGTNNASSETYTVTFNEAVSGVDAGDFALTTTGSAAGTISAVAGSGSVYTVTVDNVRGDGTLRLDLNPTGTGITDAAGNAVNGGFDTGQIYTVEHTAPTVSTINTVGANPNNSGSEQFTVTFSENVTGVAVGDFALTTTGSAAGTIASVSGTGNVYTITVNGVSGDGTMRLDLDPSGTGITDAAGNSIAGGFTGGEVYVLGHTAPVVSSITTSGNATNNASTETYTVTFNEDVTGVAIGDFSLATTGSAAGTITSVSGTGSSYTVTVSGVAGDGTMRLDLNSSGTGITDAAGNAVAGGFTGGEVYTLEHTAPTLTSVATTGNSTNNASTETYTVTFSEAVSGVAASDFSLTATGTAAGTISSVAGSGNTYTVTVDNVTGDGMLRLDLKPTGTAITDAAGNTVSGGFDTGQTYTVEHTAPTVSTINTVGANPNNSGTEQFTVTFSQNVTGVGAGDFALTTSGSAAGTIASVSGSGSVYTVTVAGVSGDGTMRLDLNPSGTGIADAAGNPIAGGFTGGEVYVLGHTAPVVSSIATTGNATNNASTETYTVTFNESVSGVGIGDFALTTSGSAAGTIASVSGSGAVYTVTVDGVSGDGTMRLDLIPSATGIRDTAGNAIVGGFTGGEVYTLEHTAPTVTSIATTGRTTNNASTETYTITFDENVAGVDVGDFALTTTGSATGTISSVAGSGNTYTVTVDNVTGDGTLRLDLKPSGTAISDAAGNAIIGGFDSGEVYTVEHSAPTVSTVNTVDANPNNAGTEHFTVTFSQEVTGVGIGDFALTTTGNVTGTIASVSGTGSVYTVTVNGVSGDGTMRLDLNANDTGIVDSAGNHSTAAFTGGEVYVLGHNAPLVTSIATTGNSTNNASTETYTLTFNEDVTGVDVGDFVLTTTGSVAGTISAIAGSGKTYTVTVDNVTGDGTLRLDLEPAGAPIIDASGIALAGPYTSGQVYTVSHNAPTITSDVLVGTSPNNLSVETFDITFSEDVTGVAVGDFVLSKTGTASGSVASVSGSGHDYTVTVDGVTGDGTLRLDLNAAQTSIVDAAGNTAPGYDTGQTVTVDHTAPTVSSVTPAAMGPSNASSDQFDVTFSENVSGVNAADFVLVSTGTAGGTITAVSGSGQHWVVTVDGVVGDGTLAVNLKGTGAGITDVAGNALGAGFDSGVALSVEHTPPSVTSVSAPPDGIYGTGENLDFTVHYDENVTLDTTHGAPYIDLTLGNGTTVRATYVAGSGTNALVFQYTVVAGIAEGGGVTLGAAIQLNGALIRDAAGNDAATALEHTAATTGVQVDTVPPSITSIDRIGPATTNADMLTYTVTFSENVNGVDASDFVVTTTGSAHGTITSISRIDGNTFQVTVGNVTGDGTVRLDLVTQSGNITDGAGNNADGGYTAGETVTVDHTAPMVISVEGPKDATYRAGQTLDYTVTFSEPVYLNTANGIPELQLNFGGSDAHFATYVGGNGTNTLTFRYTVTGSDQGSGVTLVGGIDFNGGTITDLSGNASNSALHDVSPGSGVVIGGVPPVIDMEAGQVTFDANSDSPTDTSDDSNLLTATRYLRSPTKLQTDVSDFIRASQSLRAVTTDASAAVLDYPPVSGPVASNFAFTLPVNAFPFDPAVVVTVQAALSNGNALPAWLSFDPTSGKFEGKAPAAWTQPLEIVVTARDQTGREAVMKVQVTFTAATSDAAGDTVHRATQRDQVRDIHRDARPTKHAPHGSAPRVATLHGAHHGKNAAGKPSLTDQFSRQGQTARQHEFDVLARRAS